MAEQTENKAAAGGFAPLKIPLFAVLWGATVLGNVGSFMRDVASSWLITDLSSNPSAVALMQTAATLPVFLLAIPAGVLSDILDRRRFLIFVQILLACVSGSLLLLSQTGALTVEYLLALTFVGGIGAALMGPTWQAIVPELVPRTELKNAVALNSLGINIARSIGPAAGGLLLASFGAGAAYGAAGGLRQPAGGGDVLRPAAAAGDRARHVHRAGDDLPRRACRRAEPGGDGHAEPHYPLPAPASRHHGAADRA